MLSEFSLFVSFSGIPGKKCGAIIFTAEELSNCRVSNPFTFMRVDMMGKTLYIFILELLTICIAILNFLANKLEQTKDTNKTEMLHF